MSVNVLPSCLSVGAWSFLFCVQAGRRIQLSLILCLMRADTHGVGAALIFCLCLPKVNKHAQNC